MTSSPYVVPTFRGVTIVGTALSRDRFGDMVHQVVVSTTADPSFEVMYRITSSAPASSVLLRNGTAA